MANSSYRNLIISNPEIEYYHNRATASAWRRRRDLSETGGLPKSITANETSRVEMVGNDPADPGVRAFFAELRAKGHEPINIHRTMAIAPPLMQAARSAAYAVRHDIVAPRDLCELAIIRISQLTGGHYEEAQHRPMAMSCGLSEQQLNEVASWSGSSVFDRRQRAVLAYVDAMAREDGPSDAEFQALRSFLSEREVVEMTFAAAIYAGFSMLTRALRTPLEPNAGDPSNPYGKT